MTSVRETHLKWVEKLFERGETVLQPKYREPSGRIDGYIKTQKPLKDAGAIFKHKDGTFGLFGDFGALHITGIEWEDLGLCDTRCWYEWMDPELYKPKPKKPSVNMFGERICDKDCPAWTKEFCRAKLNYAGRVPRGDGAHKPQYGQLCKLPIGFKIVVEEE